MGTEEAQLVRRAQNGDRDAFTELYHLFQPKIYRYIYFRVGSEAVAEDLTGDVFVRMVSHIDGFKYRGRPFLAWLYTIARNLITDHYRREGRATYLPLDERLVASDIDPENSASYLIRKEQLSEAMNTLTEGQRQVIWLKFFEGMDNADIAEVLDKTVGAVKALQHRALSSLSRFFTNRDASLTD
jgi:RNA polymerase sigma-70 factor (ECF subfamily)